MLEKKNVGIRFKKGLVTYVAIATFEDNEYKNIRSLKCDSSKRAKWFLNNQLRHRFKNLEEEEKARICFKYVRGSEDNVWLSMEELQILGEVPVK